MTLHDALLTLAGPAWGLHADDRARQVCFLRPGADEAATADDIPAEGVQVFPVTGAAMNGAPVASRLTAAVVAQPLIWAWLIALSILAGLSYRSMVDLAAREQVDAGLRQVQVLAGRVAELIDSMQALQARPTPASAAGNPVPDQANGDGHQ